MLGLVLIFFALTSIGSTSPKTPRGQTFLRDFPHMNINVCRTDKLYAIMQHKVYTTIIKKFFLN